MDGMQLEFATGFGESYRDCPACGKEMIQGQTECLSCGVVLKRYETRRAMEATREQVGGIHHVTDADMARMNTMWKKVVVNYHAQESHQEFLKMCQANGAIPFAVHHYSQMLEIDSDDDIAHMMRRQALSRLSVHFEGGRAEVVTTPISRTDMILKWINWIGLCFSSFLVTAGLVMPDARNLVGLGAATMIIFVALYYFRRR